MHAIASQWRHRAPLTAHRAPAINGVTLLTSYASGNCRVIHKDNEPKWLYESLERSIGSAKRVSTTNQQRASNSGETLLIIGERGLPREPQGL